MPPKGKFLPSIKAYIHPPSSSLLPFLYHTQTLERQSFWLVTRRSYSDFSTTPKRQAFTSVSESNNDDISIPFEHTQPLYRRLYSKPKYLQKDASTPTPQVPQSTLTASERAVFNRIFEDLSRSELQSQAAKESDSDLETDGLEDDVNVPYQSIETIFESAIRNEKLLEERARRRLILSESDSSTPKPADADTYEAERNRHSAMVTRMLSRADTDIKLWEVLERKVFKLTEIFKADSEEEHALGSEENTNEKLKTQANQARNDLVSFQPESNGLTSKASLSILQNNYGNYCLEALRIFRREFPASPYALHLLPTIKRLGPISYVLGASSSLYNELLYLNWTQYTDLHGMADLLLEMGNQGVETDNITHSLLSSVSRERRMKLANLSVPEQPGLDQATGAWWRLRGVQEAWDQLYPLIRKVRYEAMERRTLEHAQAKAIEKNRFENEDGNEAITNVLKVCR